MKGVKKKGGKKGRKKEEEGKEKTKIVPKNIRLTADRLIT